MKPVCLVYSIRCSMNIDHRVKGEKIRIEIGFNNKSF